MRARPDGPGTGRLLGREPPTPRRRLPRRPRLRPRRRPRQRPHQRPRLRPPSSPTRCPPRASAPPWPTACGSPGGWPCCPTARRWSPSGPPAASCRCAPARPRSRWAPSPVSSPRARGACSASPSPPPSPRTGSSTPTSPRRATTGSCGWHGPRAAPSARRRSSLPASQRARSTTAGSWRSDPADCCGSPPARRGCPSAPRTSARSAARSCGSPLTGRCPADNPFPGSPIWSYGHRNVQGLAFDSTGQLWASEFGARDRDELNRIERGGNYGWPAVEGPGGAPTYVDPYASWPTSEASPSGLAIVADVAYLGALRGQRLWQVPLAGPQAGQPRAFLEGAARPGPRRPGRPRRRPVGHDLQHRRPRRPARGRRPGGRGAAGLRVRPGARRSRRRSRRAGRPPARARRRRTSRRSARRRRTSGPAPRTRRRPASRTG